MESEKFCLRWNDFESNISTAFRELREDKDFFDVTLACDDDQIEAHKVILSACSPFFKTILKRNRHQHPLLYLKGVKYTELTAILNFMYHGEVNVAQEELNSFLGVAEELKVKGLTAGVTNSKKNNSVKPKEISQMRNEDISPEPKKAKMFPQAPIIAKTAANNTSDDDIQEVLPVKLEPVLIQSEPLTSQSMNTMSISNPYSAGGSGQNTSMVENNTIFADDFGEFENYDDSGEGFDHSILPEQMNTDGNKETSVLEETIGGLMSSFKDETGLIVWQCEVCNLQMKKKYRMKRHVEGFHVSGFVHSCNICGSNHKSKAALEAHTYQKHRGPQF